ncbi:dimethylaniline monooxygenase [N-oxide-forming] 3-like [Contarinia nasturtii]|uniref:dimethylaniline monooxygenase [N-oxide-forming] 3-like n=1 Tax=Contarinia nasturtii TaxID=265458 RepID=UPI0012D41769|nr:dimethylaniline monooxygenase [N-oxide-forming] 3-like [Contarinia nasturtii]
MSDRMGIVARIKWILLPFILEFLEICSALNIAVIGAGPSGIVSAKNAIAQGHNVTIFEKTGTLGGIWYYTEETGTDEYGVEIHTPMYRDLTTNLAKHLMIFPNVPPYTYPYGTPSYPSHEDVWKYLNSFAEEFHVKELIRYHHFVDKIVVKKNGKWEVTVLRKNLCKQKQKETHEFDAVFVCSGINFEKRIPNIEGACKFKGKTMHSRDYRIPETFIGENESILVIGKGPSGYDIVEQLKKVGISVVHSSYQSISLVEKILGTAIAFCEPKDFHDECEKPDCNPVAESGKVRRFMGKNQVEFQYGPCLNFSMVIYATGYKFSYPFLDKSVGIRVKDNYIEPLYMHILNIQHPSMAFIGVAYGGISFKMYELQSRFALKFITGTKPLPSQKEMLDYSKNISLKVKPHLLGRGAEDYYSSLEAVADN